MLKKKLYVHQNIPYAFNWNIIHHKEKLTESSPNREEFRTLGSYFKKVYQGTIPNDIFNQRELPRVSQFKIRGLKPAFIVSFSKSLIREGKIKLHDSTSRLPKFVNDVFETFKNSEIRKKPGHEPILKNILIRDKNSVAIEIPIWRKIKNDYVTGHIDLIQIDDNIIKVIDYKPEGNFMLSLPQVATYGLFIESMFNLSKVKCISFNKRGAWEYDPHILLTDVKDYLISQRVVERKWEEFLE
ncbi:MAG: hypothetical protein ACFE96_12145 [Candidatus Hermodarchaeota archaeon]